MASHTAGSDDHSLSYVCAAILLAVSVACGVLGMYGASWGQDAGALAFVVALALLVRIVVLRSGHKDGHRIG